MAEYCLMRNVMHICPCFEILYHAVVMWLISTMSIAVWRHVFVRTVGDVPSR